jgi:PIN domain nuclease of toxin-antitoxin system
LTVLLDTHVWLWMLTAPRRLAGRARDLIEDPQTVERIPIVTSDPAFQRYDVEVIPAV